MNGEVKIRSFKRDDLDDLFRLSNQLSDAVKVERNVLEENIVRIAGKEDHVILIAESDRRVVGYLSAYFHWAIYANGQVAYIDEIVVAKERRHRGIGTELLSQFERLAENRKCVLISLATAGAKAFYEKQEYRSKASYYKKYLK